MSKGHEITRRALLAGAGASISVAALSVAAVSAQPSPVSLEALIEAHRQAYAVHEDACGALMTAQDSIRTLPDILAPEAVYPDGTHSTSYRTRIFSAEDIRAKIASRHAELRRIHCGPWAHKMVGSYADVLLAELVV